MSNRLAAAFAASAVALSLSVMRGDDVSLRFDTFKVSPEVSLHLPVIPGDSSLAAKNSFSNDKLLKSVNRKLDRPSAGWTEVRTDTSFSVRFPKAENGPVLRTIATRMRPERFLKGTLRLKSNVMAELSDSYGSLLTISQADSVPSWDKANLTLEPAETADLFISFISFPEDPEAPCLELEFEPDEGFESVMVASGPAVTTRFRVDESALGTRVSRASISPDGKYMILSYSTMYGENNYRSWSELQECSTGRILNASLPYGSFWMPKGSSLGYTVKTDDTYSLYSLDASTQKQTLIATELPDNSFTISPDCSFLVIYRFVEGTKDSGPVKRLRDPDDRLAGHRNRYYLEKYDLKTGIRQPLTYGGNTTSVYDISPDSKKLIYGAQTEKMDVFPFYFNDLIELDLTTLSTDTLVKADPYVQSCSYSPDGKKIFLTGGPEALGGIGKNNGGHKYSNDYDVQGYIMTLSDKSIHAVTRDFNPSIEGEPIWNSVDGQIYFRASDGFTLNVYRLDPKSGNIVKIDFGMAYISCLLCTSPSPRD